MNLAKSWQERKPTELEWLPSVPAHWTRTRLGWAADMVSGGTPSKAERSYWDGEIPWVSPKDMKRPDIADSIDHVTPEALRDTGLKLIDPPAVLIVVRGMILAHSFPVARILAPVTINQDMKALKFRTGIDDRFAVYLLNGIRDVILAEVEQAAHGTCRLTSQRWKKIEAYLPPIEEQRAIADFLDRETAKIDRLIGQKKRLLELLDEKRTAMITRAVTKGLDPGVKMKDSGVEWLGEVPAHWRVAQVGRLVRVGNGSTPSRSTPDYWQGGSIPWLTSTKINDEIISESDEFVTARAFRECHLPLVPPRSVLVAITGEGQTRGRAALLQTPCTISQHLAYLTPASSNLSARYLWRFLQSRYEWLRVESNGAGSTRAALTCQFLKRVPVPLPPMEEQIQIAQHLEAAEDEDTPIKIRVQRGAQLLHALKVSLVSSLVTGQLETRLTKT